MQIAKSVKRTNAFYSTNPFASIACYKLYGNAQKCAVEKKLQAIVRSKSVAYFTAHPKKSLGVASSSASQKVHTSHICASKLRLESANTHVREKERESEVVRTSASIPTPPHPTVHCPADAIGHSPLAMRAPLAGPPLRPHKVCTQLSQHWPIPPNWPPQLAGRNFNWIWTRPRTVRRPSHMWPAHVWAGNRQRRRQRRGQRSRHALSTSAARLASLSQPTQRLSHPLAKVERRLVAGSNLFANQRCNIEHVRFVSSLLLLFLVRIPLFHSLSLLSFLKLSSQTS